MKKKEITLSLIVLIILCVIVFTNKSKLYDAKYVEPSSDLLAITIDGEISTTFPTSDAYEGTVSCTTGTGSVSWNGTKWILTTSGITKGSTKCNVSFSMLLYKAILANNEVKTPLTTPGSEVSAYKESDVTTTSTSSVPAAYHDYYVTYGTGWEANGTKFNLTGTVLTTDIYSNSYQSLVGKYLPSNWIASSGSCIAGDMVTTTNLDAVYYVVSATSSSFTYKIISSNRNATEALLASTEDDYGTSYYFRGLVTNNYVEFANKCWRVVRIGGDNTIKLILHNDNTPNASNPCSSANNSGTAAFAHYDGDTYTSKFNEKYGDNAYVGFMYGTPGSSTYEATHANTNKSTILINLETWYNNNLKTYESVIVDNVFCNDKTNVTDTAYNPVGYGGDATGLGYGTNKTYYGASQRLAQSRSTAGGTGPSLKCNGTLSKVRSKIGLITADELAYAGYAASLCNTGTYLQDNATGHRWWSLTPAIYNSGDSHVWYVDDGTDAGGLFGLGSFPIGAGVRPYISLRSSINVTGEGTSENPYKVIL